MKKDDKPGPNQNQPAGPGAREQQARTTARSGFKVAVANELAAKGFSRREATRAVNAIVESMKDAVKRGEVVETPFGTVKRTLIRPKAAVDAELADRKADAGEPTPPTGVGVPARFPNTESEADSPPRRPG
jgi:nucleoid DNA-binding protein